MTTPQPTDTSKRDNRFVADPNSGETMAWLINADAILNRGMGGALGTDLSERLSRIYRERKAPVHILDIACGPGGWVIEVAGEHPEYEVTGVDIGQPMIDYARSLAKVRGFDNAHFSRMDVLKPLDFPNEAFDLVNARTLFGFMSPDTWPQLLGECLRITRPGGMIRLTELEAPVTTSPALNWLWDVAARSLFIHLAHHHNGVMRRPTAKESQLACFERYLGHRDENQVLPTWFCLFSDCKERG